MGEGGWRRGREQHREEEDWRREGEEVWRQVGEVEGGREEWMEVEEVERGAGWTWLQEAVVWVDMGGLEGSMAGRVETGEKMRGWMQY